MLSLHDLTPKKQYRVPSYSETLKSSLSVDWSNSSSESFLDSPIFSESMIKSKLRPLPIPRNKRGRKKRGEVAVSPVTLIDNDTITAYGSLFKIKRPSTNDGNSIIKCEACKRKFKKKSVRSHVISKLHQNKLN